MKNILKYPYVITIIYVLVILLAIYGLISLGQNYFALNYNLGSASVPSGCTNQSAPCIKFVTPSPLHPNQNFVISGSNLVKELKVYDSSGVNIVGTLRSTCWIGCSPILMNFNLGSSLNPGVYQIRMIKGYFLSGNYYGNFFPISIVSASGANPTPTPPITGSNCSMQQDSAIRGCSNYVQKPPVNKPDATSCSNYCISKNADACEYSNSDCYVEFGNNCSVQGGFTGWSAALCKASGSTIGGSGSAPISTPDPGLNPVANKAIMISQSVPQTMNAGQTYPVSITMQNLGTNTWSCCTTGHNYKLGSINPIDNQLWGLYRVNIPGNVSYGQTVTFNFNVTAPDVNTTSVYNFQWAMVNDLVNWFGDPTQNVNITIQPTSGSSGGGGGGHGGGGKQL